jgi:hypothetical protein
MRGPLGAQKGPGVKKCSFNFAVCVTAACVGRVTEASFPRPMEAAPIVQVDRTTLFIAFPAQAGADVTWPVQQLPPGYPGPEWRVMIEAGDGLVLVASLRLVPDSTQVLGPYTSTAEALKRAQLRECEVGQHTIWCLKLLNGEAAVEGKEVVIRIRDHSLIARLKANEYLHPKARLNFRRNQQEMVWQGIVYLDFL